jgi:GNAT superfamily N-acetyltransferase
MKVEFTQEFLFMIESDLEALAKDHYSEVNHNPAVPAPKFDKELFRNLERMDMLRIFTAREQGDLVGYLVVVISPDFNVQGNSIPEELGFYIHKSYRAKGVGQSLLQFSEQCLKEDGHKTLVMSSTNKNPVDDFYKAMGYKEITRKYEKVL